MAREALATAWIQLQPSFEGLKANISREISGVPTDKLGKETGSRFTGGVSKGLAKLGGTVAAAFAAKKVADFFADSMNAVKNWQILNAQTEAVVKSTGGAAGITASQVNKLAESLENMTATQAESIQEGANMLLTFKNIKNGVGEGNDIFNQATAALVDMSRAMGTDPQQAAIQLGKALNDPIQGVSALSRVGIQFTDDQKALIQSLWDAGDAAGAQKIILEELNDQFGGSGQAYAETYAGKIDLLRDAFGDVGEKIVTKLMPNLETLIDWLNEDGIEIVEDFGDGISELAEGFATLEQETGWFSGFVDDMKGVGGFIDDIERWGEALANIGNPKERGNWAKDQIQRGGILGWWLDEATKFGDKWGWLWGHKVPSDVESGISGAQRGGGKGMSAMGVDLSRFEEATKGKWSGLWRDVDSSTRTGGSTIGASTRVWVDALGVKFASVWRLITSAFSVGHTQISDFMARVGNVVDQAKKKFEQAGQGIRAAFKGIGKFIKDAFKPITDLMGGFGSTFKTFFGGAGDRARHFKGLATKAGSGGGGGPALARVRASMPSGLRVTDTLSNPARDRALGLKRSRNSYHYDTKNPAVDIAGPTWLLHQYAKKLRAMGGWRQLLWQVPGHYDHIHVAHTGGVVQSSWYRSPGDKWDERTVRLQVGETVLPKGVSPVSASYEVAPGSSGPRTVILQVGDREFEAYLSEVADGRIGAYDGARARRGVLGYGGPV